MLLECSLALSQERGAGLTARPMTTVHTPISRFHLLQVFQMAPFIHFL
jgi:hypothetical protein